jgi:hypothetical protein
MSAPSENMLKAKDEILHNVVDKLNKEKGTNIHLINYEEFAKLYNLKARSIYDLPAVILSLVPYSGLSWVGTYCSFENMRALIEKTDALFQKHNVPSYVMLKTMKSGHYGIFRPIFRFKKFEDQERMVKLIEEITDLCIDEGCIPYKTPAWMTAKMREKINPGWIKLFEKVKECMDPNGIFNPGRWNT